MARGIAKVLLVVYDNDSYIHWFPQGTAYIAAVLRRKGYDVTVYSQDVHHHPDEHLTRYLDENRFDVVGVGVIAGYYQYRKLLKLSEAVNRSKQRPYFILGGHGPSPEPEFFLRKTGADCVLVGEGETTIVELLEALGRGDGLEGVKGVAWLEGGRLRAAPRRELVADIDALPFPEYGLFPMEYYRLLRMPHAESRDFVLPLLSGRGCTFTCNFCYRMDEGFRPRSSEAIIEEIRLLQARYGVTYIAFSDELLMSSKARTVGLCEDFLRAGLRFKWDCNGRLNYATPDVLQVMKRAGCVFINYGIEAVDDAVLRNMKKALTVEQITKGIEATLAAGISPGFNIIFGNIGDDRKTLQKGVDFLLKHDDGAQMRNIRPVTPYPGSPLYYHAIEKGLLKDAEDFYERKHVNSDLLSVNFTELSDDEFHRGLYEANKRLFENYMARKLENLLAQTKSLYLDRNAAFRGFRQT